MCQILNALLYQIYTLHDSRGYLVSSVQSQIAADGRQNVCVAELSHIVELVDFNRGLAVHIKLEGVAKVSMTSNVTALQIIGITMLFGGAAAAQRIGCRNV